MAAPFHALLKPLALGLLTLALALLALVWNGAPPAARADGPCTVCLDGGCDYAAIQPAVDNPGCTEIKVAQGMYTGVQARPVPAGYDSPPASGLITQVVYISRTVTVRGGYTVTNWTVPDPWTQPTTLDAGGLGRVLVVAGDISPTIEGLSLAGGDAAGLGGDAARDGGGGVYVLSATTTLSACRVAGNAADIGGGLLLRSSDATLSANSITSNTAASEGGGLYLYYSSATLSANSVASNTAYSGGGLYLSGSASTLEANNVFSNSAASYGGGVYLFNSAATLSANTVVSNTAAYYGGGLCLYYSPVVTVSANRVAANTAGSEGGGLYLYNSDAALSANSVTSNTAGSLGGGLYLWSSAATLINTVVADNQAGANGSGLYINTSAPRLLHTTIARNGGGDGSGLSVSSAASTVRLTNTILTSQTLGISVTFGAVVMSNTLWYGNASDYEVGAGTISHSGDFAGDPAFVDPGRGDYHIGPTSAAIDRGVDAGVTTDKDGLPRDARPDLGAYEFQGPATSSYLYLPLIVKGAR
jgi:parallel beta-helix repeat protein